jgi:succinate-semialdehyde dehydrogenase/glutarate-semialdehyde dehydrogenase
MALKSVNPVSGQTVKIVETWNETQLDQALAEVAAATPGWAAQSFPARADALRRVAQVLRARQDDLARTMTLEMGKLIGEARSEIEKCAWVCDFYAEHGANFLADEPIDSDAGRSLVAYQPLGTVLAVMPWNFPFWQVFRFAAPALMAGNTAVLKHASNVPGCAMAIEEVFLEAGLPQNVFRTLLIPAGRVNRVIEDKRVHAVTLTGSEAAGRAVAATAGHQIKKTVLELGGSDPFIVLEDADLDAAVKTAVISRFLNAGQSCIAAKRFIPVAAIADEFVGRFKEAVEELRCGDPMAEGVTLAPMARLDLREELHQQVIESITKGAVAVTGCTPMSGEGAYYQASILDRVVPGMRAYREEFFGPVALILRAADEVEAIRIANDSPFGLGGSVWTRDTARGERVARKLQCGAAFVNGLVKSDPRLPFGGIKHSGYGRELARHGIREFVNAKTIWMR